MGRLHEACALVSQCNVDGHRVRVEMVMLQLRQWPGGRRTPSEKGAGGVGHICGSPDKGANRAMVSL